MTLRTRLILLFGGLLALLAAAQWLLVRSLTQDLGRERQRIAFAVGSSVLSLVGTEVDGDEPRPAEAASLFTLAFEEAAPGVIETELPEGAAEAGPAGLAPARHLVRKRLLCEGDSPIEGKLRGVLLAEDPPLPSGTRANAVVRLEAGDGRLEKRPRDALPPEDETLAIQVFVSSDGAQPRGPLPADVEARLEQYREWVESAAERGSDTTVETTTDTFHFGVPALPHAAEWVGTPVYETHIPVPGEGMRTAIDAFHSRWLGGVLALAGLGLLAVGFLAHRVSAPLERLASAAQRVGDGAVELSDMSAIAVDESGDREVRATIGSFNRMTRRLAELDAEARELRERQHLFELGEVARGLAHAMRNPLNTLGFAVEELASEGTSAARRGELVSTARDQIRRVDESLRSFLALGRGPGR